MPKMPPKPCSYPGCRYLSKARGRCEQHQREAWETSKGKTAEERGYGSAWKKIRKQALARDNFLCIPCERNGIYTPASEVDHVTPKSRGGTDELNNLQSICSDCHKLKTQAEKDLL